MRRTFGTAIFSASVLCALFALPAQAIEFSNVQAEKSRLGFTFRQMGVPVSGSFRRFLSALSFDPAHHERATARIEIDLASIDAGSDEANDEVKSPQWFNTKAFPRASFVSTAVKSLGGGHYEVTGTMTIKGRSRIISAPFTVKQEGTRATFEGSFVIKRAEFSIGEGPWADFGTVANEIQINFYIPATSVPGK